GGNSRAMSGTLLSIGHGYTAQALARVLIPRGWTIIGTTRSADRAAIIRAAGVETVAWPVDDMPSLLARATHLLSSVAPTEAGDPVLLRHSRAIADAAPRLHWAGYLSTTAVYGDHGGGWVDEKTPLAPTTGRGRQRVEAERAWLSLAARSGLPVHIFRLA